MVLQVNLRRLFGRFDLKPWGIPSLLCTMIWRLCLSDALLIFPPLLAGSELTNNLDLLSAPYVIATGVANVVFIPPSVSALLLLSVGWLLAKPTPLCAIWA